ncbi:MAG: hypothetical protein KJZ70_19100 [Bryobacterales bacterium]|nr:hypothetical protein [Bryobacterales bacterium]
MAASAVASAGMHSDKIGGVLLGAGWGMSHEAIVADAGRFVEPLPGVWQFVAR